MNGDLPLSENVLTTPDLIVFFGSLVAVLAIGLWASRREETSEDFFLAGRNTRLVGGSRFDIRQQRPAPTTWWG